MDHLLLPAQLRRHVAGVRADHRPAGHASGLCAGHGLVVVRRHGAGPGARSASFAAACGLLGMGEAGSFPGSIKAVAEWFPKRERALATGIFNSGTAVGAVISYPLVGWLFLRWGWQMAFVGTGALGLVLCRRLAGSSTACPASTLGSRRRNSQHIETEPGDDHDAPGAPLSWGKILGYRPGVELHRGQVHDRPGVVVLYLLAAQVPD